MKRYSFLRFVMRGGRRWLVLLLASLLFLASVLAAVI